MLSAKLHLYGDTNLIGNFYDYFDYWDHNLRESDSQGNRIFMVLLLNRHIVWSFSQEAQEEINKIPNSQVQYAQKTFAKAFDRARIIQKCDKTDLLRANNFFATRLSGRKLNQMDIQYIGNCMRKENAVDYFVTFDNRTILRFANEIEKELGVRVRSPGQLFNEIWNNTAYTNIKDEIITVLAKWEKDL
jgi:hypothetical protein